MSDSALSCTLRTTNVPGPFLITSVLLRLMMYCGIGKPFALHVRVTSLPFTALLSAFPVVKCVTVGLPEIKLKMINITIGETSCGLAVGH